MGSNSVDAALAAPVDDIGSRLLALPEDQWFERKSAAIAPKDLAAALVALANAEGGTVVVGASNNRVAGVAGQRRRINELRQAPVRHTVPPVRVHFSEVECRNDAGAPDVLLVLRVEPGESVHELTNGDSFLRVGDSSQRLSFAHRQELEYDKGQAQYDGRTARGADFADLDADLVQNYQRQVGATRSAPEVLAARNLLDRSGMPTNAAVLLFGRRPQTVFPEAYLRVLRFRGRERGTGARLDLDDDGDVRIEGSIPRIVAEATKVIERRLPARRSLSASGTFEATPIVPRDAWLEGVVNAVIHRSYSLGGDHIRVEIYSDRIEIESPGRFPGLADPSNPLRVTRFARNPRIARVCSDLRIGQELGEGIKRMFDEMRLVGLTDPAYTQLSGSVRLILSAMPRLDPKIAATLPRGSEQVLHVLRAAGRPLGTGDLGESLGLSRPAVLARLRALRDAGIITWIGKSANDPRAVWTLPE